MDITLIMMSATSILTIAIGFITFFIGYLIRYQKMVEIVAASFSHRIKDKEGFGNWVGSNIILAGIMGFVFGSLGLFYHSYIGGLMIYGFILSLFFIVSRIKSGTRKFM